MSTKEIDASFDLPYTRLPHPRYRNKDNSGMGDDKALSKPA